AAGPAPTWQYEVLASRESSRRSKLGPGFGVATPAKNPAEPGQSANRGGTLGRVAVRLKIQDLLIRFVQLGPGDAQVFPSLAMRSGSRLIAEPAFDQGQPVVGLALEGPNLEDPPVELGGLDPAPVAFKQPCAMREDGGVFRDSAGQSRNSPRQTFQIA